MSNSRQSALLDAVVIGAGFAGVGMAIALSKAGVHDLLILERSDELGGVWRDNTYPGAACDVPSHLYSFSFALNPHWSQMFAGQDEIKAYLERCAAEFGVLPKIRFDSAVMAADWDDQQSLWRVALVDGTHFDTRILISAVGLLGSPAMPDVPGLDRLGIPSFHSGRWRHDIDLADKRLAVIGTGASAVQFVPPLAEQAHHLTIFQRSPPWIMPRSQRAYSDAEKLRFARHPWLMRLYRLLIYAKYESRAIALTRFHGIMTIAIGRPFAKMLARISDPSLRAKMLPNYPIACKRILVASNYLTALSRTNVELVTEPIHTMTQTGVQTADGRHREFDVVIYGTGFATAKYLAPMKIRGRGGRDLNAAWCNGAKAYLGMTVAGFPNLFLLYGPNTNLGHNSIIFMIESQISHVMRCLKQMRDGGATAIEIKNDVYLKQHARVRRRLAKSVWQGCRSWYVDTNGHISTNWPGFSFTYRWLSRRVDRSVYLYATQPAASVTSLSSETRWSIALKLIKCALRIHRLRRTRPRRLHGDRGAQTEVMPSERTCRGT